MQQREKILLLVVAGALLGGLGLPQLSGVFLAPIEESQRRLQSVKKNLASKAKDVLRVKQAGQSLKLWRSRSLPPNPLDAQRLFQTWLTDLAQMSQFTDVKVSPGRRNAKGKVYTGVLVLLEGKTKLSQLSRFLYHFYRTDLSHRILSLTVRSTGSRGDPVLEVSLTAEGLVVGGTAPRRTLFVQTVLKAGFQSKRQQQTIEVAEDGGFPDMPGFRIQIGDEFLNVVDMAGNRWTVRGGDSTQFGNHKSGDVVQLASVHPDYAERGLDDFRLLVENSPFVKLVRNDRSPQRPASPRSVPVADHTAAETYLVASIVLNHEPQAWLYRKENSERTLIREGSQFLINDVKAVVLAIRSDHILLRCGEDVCRLRMGDNLNSLQKLPNRTTSRNRRPVSADLVPRDAPVPEIR